MIKKRICSLEVLMFRISKREMSHLMLGAFVIILIFFSQYIPILKVIYYKNPYSDKYMHAAAGIILAISFPALWRKKLKYAFWILLIINILWESFEIFGYEIGWFIQAPFGKEWFFDTMLDIYFTMLTGLGLCILSHEFNVEFSKHKKL